MLLKFRKKNSKFHRISKFILLSVFIGCTHTEESNESMGGWKELQSLEEGNCTMIDPDPFLQHSEVRSLLNGKKVIFLQERNRKTVVETVATLADWSPENVVGLRLPRDEEPIAYDESTETITTSKEINPTQNELLFRTDGKLVGKQPWPNGFRQVWPETGSGYLLAESGQALIALGKNFKKLEEVQHKFSPEAFDEPYLFYLNGNQSIVFYTSQTDELSRAVWFSIKSIGPTVNQVQKSNLILKQVSEWGAQQIGQSRFVIWAIEGDSFSGDAKWQINIVDLNKGSLSIVKSFSLPIGEVNVGSPHIRADNSGFFEFLGWLGNEKILYRIALNDENPKLQKVGYLEEEDVAFATYEAAKSIVIQKKENGLNRLGVCTF